jgi:hypothetical protein
MCKLVSFVPLCGAVPLFLISVSGLFPCTIILHMYLVRGGEGGGQFDYKQRQ